MLRKFISYFLPQIGKWCREDSGASVVEYVLVASGVALAIAGIIFAFGDELSSLFFETLPDLLDGGS